MGSAWIVSFGCHVEISLSKALCGYGSCDGTDTTYFIMIAYAQRRKWYLTLFKSLSYVQIKYVPNYSLHSVGLTLILSSSGPLTYIFLYILLVTPTYTQRISLQLMFTYVLNTAYMLRMLLVICLATPSINIMLHVYYVLSRNFCGLHMMTFKRPKNSLRACSEVMLAADGQVWSISPPSHRCSFFNCLV